MPAGMRRSMLIAATAVVSLRVVFGSALQWGRGDVVSRIENQPGVVIVGRLVRGGNGRDQAAMASVLAQKS